MRRIINLVVILAAGYGGYVLYDQFSPPEWPRWERIEILLPSRGLPRYAEDASDREPLIAGVTGPGLHRIVCPTCDGERRLSYADSRGANRVYPCPICNSLGTRTVQVNPGQRICPDCRGMGLTERRESRRSFGGKRLGDRHSRTRGQCGASRSTDLYIRSSRCMRCNTTGVITSLAERPPVATPGVQTPQPAR